MPWTEEPGILSVGHKELAMPERLSLSVNVKSFQNYNTDVATYQ